MFKPAGTSVRKEARPAPAGQGSPAAPPRVAGLRGSRAQGGREDRFMCVGGQAGVGFSQGNYFLDRTTKAQAK